MSATRVTSIEVAKRAGVSQSAVSRAYTPGAPVSQKTAEKVRKAALELGYQPNSLARSLITGKSRIIGFIVAYLDNQFYPESLQKLSARLAEEGYHMLIFTVYNEPEKVAKTVRELMTYQVDAIVAASVSLSNDLAARCKAGGVPMVLYNRSQDSDLFSSVTSDNLAGGRAVARHFAELGVERPAYIAGWAEASTQRDREIGFRRGLEERGLKLFARGEGNFNYQQARAAARSLFSPNKRIERGERGELPDALFVANDHMAFAAMDCLRHELGLRIPEDVKVVGYDDVAIASWPSYDLTSVRQPADQMVATTVEALLQAIENPDAPPTRIAIEGPLIVRGSTQKRESK